MPEADTGFNPGKAPRSHYHSRDDAMPLFEDRSASFIVRVWCESGGDPLGAVRAWRGSIEHVSSSQRVFFQELDAVIAFMKPHLVALGIDEPNRFWERMSDLSDPPTAQQRLALEQAAAAHVPPRSRTGSAARRRSR